MKKLIFLLSIVIFPGSCEIAKNDPINLRNDFNQKILEGYFVLSIAFDNQGNAWIGTFKQGLIKNYIGKMR